MLTEVRNLMIKALKANPLGAQRVLNEMEAGKKINAIKELRELGRDVTTLKTTFGLRESKHFVEEYYTTTSGYGANYSFKVDSERFKRDISNKRKGSNYNAPTIFDAVDLNQVSTDDLMGFRKRLNKELKKRGKKL